MDRLDPNDPDLDAELRELCQRAQIGQFKRLAEETKNPLYIWEAILYCSAYQYPLPDWCLSYIVHSAMEIHDLITKASTQQFSVNDMGCPFVAELTPEQAANAIPAALQIRKETRNAFERMAADRKYLEDYMTVSVAQMFEEAAFVQPQDMPAHSVLTVREAEERVKARANIDNTKSLRNRLRRGQQLQNRIIGRDHSP